MSSRTLFGFIFIGLFVTVGVILWARSDVGVIDVSSTINTSNQASVGEDGSGNVALPASAAFANMENGGLVPQDSGAAPQPEPTPVPQSDDSSGEEVTDAPTATSSTDSTSESEDGESTTP